jgi:hypothetical protein
LDDFTKTKSMISTIPDLFVIGAMKAGTSTLHRNILVHEKIERTKEKEVNYFLYDHDVQKMSALYSTQFLNYNAIKCDVSPKYAQRHLHEGVPERIAKFNPGAKIIYIVRDPVERIESHLHHDLLRDRLKFADVNQAVRNNKNYLLTSNYFYQVSSYLDHFPFNQILVLQLEELKTDPGTFCDRISDFLGVPGIVSHDKKFNVSDMRYQIKFYDLVHDRVKAKFFLKWYHYLWYFINIKPHRPVLASATVDFLKQNLRSDVQSMAKSFGLNTHLWKNFTDGTD